MRKNSLHTNKSKLEKDYYSKYIKKQDYEPTVDETLRFSTTDDAKNDYSIPKNKKRRKLSLKQQIFDHFEDNWIKWIAGLIGAVLFWLMFNSKLSISRVEYKVDDLKDNIKELKENDKEFNNKLQDQQLKNRETEIKLQEMERYSTNNK